MPIYEYECSNCHHHFDLMQKISDAPVKKCPQCFEDAAVRLVSAAGFQLKGSGWYATDFKNNHKQHGSNEKKAGDNAASATNTANPSSTDSQKSTKSERE